MHTYTLCLVGKGKKEVKAERVEVKEGYCWVRFYINDEEVALFASDQVISIEKQQGDESA